jgi:broad specificity phosphatase PhoE
MLYLLRHGETDWNCKPTRCSGWQDVPLNGNGRRQAHEEGRRLAGKDIDLIITSHLDRARETAEIVLAELQAARRERGRAQGERPIELVVDERLAETRRGEWEGREFADIKEDFEDAYTQYREHPETFRFPGGESFAEQEARVLAAVRDAALTGRVALLVTHGGSLRLFRAFNEGCGAGCFHDLKVGNAAVLEVPTDGLAERIDAYLAGAQA